MESDLPKNDRLCLRQHLIRRSDSGALPNSNITWSTVTLWNAGLEFGFLNNRLSGEVDVWGKNESDILGTRLGSTPTTLGASLPAENYAERSWSGVELSADWRDQIGDVSYSMYANMGYAVDQWDIYDEAESLTDGTYADNWRSRIGKPADRVEGYISQGMIRTEAQLNALPEDFTQFGREPMLGTLLFEDIRGDNFSEGPDGKIDENDLTYLSNNGAPRINYGFGFNIAWKGLAVNTLFQGVGAYDRMISTRNGGGVFQVDRPYFEIWANDYWTPEHPEATYPRIAGNWMQPEYGGGPSSFWLRNGAYLRLKNINIGYTLPRQWYDAIGISTIQLFVNGTNLLVISDLTEHDPEQETLDSYPLMKTFTGGANYSILTTTIMKKMKYAHTWAAHFISLLLVFVIVAGCGDVLDEVQDLSNYPEQGVFNEEQTANAYLAALYASTLPGWPVNAGDYADEGGRHYRAGLDYDHQ